MTTLNTTPDITIAIIFAKDTEIYRQSHVCRRSRVGGSVPRNCQFHDSVPSMHLSIVSVCSGWPERTVHMNTGTLQLLKWPSIAAGARLPYLFGIKTYQPCPLR